MSPSSQAGSFQFAANPRPVLIGSLLRWALVLLTEAAPAARARGDAAEMVALARQTIDLCILSVLVDAHRKVPDDCFFHGRLPEKMYVDGLAAYRNVLGLDHGPARILVDRVEQHPGWQLSDGDLVVSAAGGIVRNFILRYLPDMAQSMNITELPSQEDAAPLPAWVAEARAARGLGEDDFG